MDHEITITADGAMHPKIQLLLWALALVSAGNAIWMLLHAWSWFRWIPGVTNTGAANTHFIHDVGIVYLLCALGLVWCMRRPQRGYPLLVGITLFFCGHALGHVIEIILGQLPMSHWIIDIPLVFAPALMLGVFVVPAIWNRIIDYG